MSVDARGLHFKVVDLFGLVNFEWHSQSKVVNMAFLYCGVCEKLLCNTPGTHKSVLVISGTCNRTF